MGTIDTDKLQKIEEALAGLSNEEIKATFEKLRDVAAKKEEIDAVLEAAKL